MKKIVINQIPLELTTEEAVNKLPDKRIIIIDPYIIKFENTRAHNRDNWQDISKKDKQALADKIKRTQRSAFMAAAYNVKTITPDKIEILPLETGSFLKKYFSENGTKFIDFIDNILRPIHFKK